MGRSDGGGARVLASSEDLKEGRNHGIVQWKVFGPLRPPKVDEKDKLKLRHQGRPRMELT